MDRRYWTQVGGDDAQWYSTLNESTFLSDKEELLAEGARFRTMITDKSGDRIYSETSHR